MLELSPYLIVTTFNLIRRNRGITQEDLIEKIKEQTEIHRESWEEAILNSVKFLLDANLITKLPGVPTRFKKADKADLSISEAISNGFARKAKEIARRTVSTVPAHKIREALLEKKVSECILTQEQALSIKCHSPIGLQEYHFELRELEDVKGISSLINEQRMLPDFQIIYNAPVIDHLELEFTLPADKKISASDASRYTVPVETPLATNDLTRSRQLIFTVAAASRWVGVFSEEGPKGEFQSVPDLIDLEDSFGYGAIEELTTIHRDDFVADQRYAQAYFQMEKMHNDLDLIGLEENPTDFHIRDGPIVPHSYRDPKFYTALSQAKRLVDLALHKNILYFGFVKYSADKALTSFVNSVIFNNILKGAIPENFWSDFGLLSQVLEDKDVTVPIIRLDRGFDDQKQKCLLPYMSFYLKIFDWVARIDIPWLLCKHDPLGYRNRIAKLVYSLSSIEYAKPGTPQIVPFPIAMVDEMAKIVAQNFIDISIKQFYEELGELIDTKK